MGDTIRLAELTGSIDHPEVIHHFTFRNGKVIRCRTTEDTANTMAAFAR